MAADIKGKVSPVLYVLGIVCAAAFSARIGLAIFVFVALMWLVPDRRVEQVVAKHGE